MAKKQAELKGIEKPSIAEVDNAADDYIKSRDKYKALAEQLKGEAEVLIASMKRHKLTRYAVDGYVVAIEDIERVKVKAKDDDGDD